MWTALRRMSSRLRATFGSDNNWIYSSEIVCSRCSLHRRAAAAGDSAGAAPAKIANSATIKRIKETLPHDLLGITGNAGICSGKAGHALPRNGPAPALHRNVERRGAE